MFEMKNRRRLSAAVVLLCVIMAAAFALPRPARAVDMSKEGRVLRVAAASDLTFALRELAEAFEKETGVRVVASLGSTGMLARQIEHGAPFDLFFAANVSYVERLESLGRVIPGTARIYAEGRLVLAVNAASGIVVKDLAGLRAPEVTRIAIANPDHAPYGTAAMEALKSAGLWDDITPKLVYGENVRQTLRFIQTGNARAGLVALSVSDVPEITSTPVDSSLHNPIEQAAAVVTGTRMESAARSFIEYVNGPVGRPVMKRYGFFLPGDR